MKKMAEPSDQVSRVQLTERLFPKCVQKAAGKISAGKEREE